MEPTDYQGIEVEEVKVCKGACYQNIWWVEEPTRKEDSTIHFWVYWEALQAAVVKFLRLSEEVVVKYQRIMQFAIGPHTIHN